jgi:hypothetical protein
MAATDYERARFGRAALDTVTIPIAVPVLTAITLAVAGALFALYIPQLATGQPLRVAHGVLILVGALVLAWAIWPRRGEEVRA